MPGAKSLADRLTAAAGAPIRGITSAVLARFGRHPFGPRDEADGARVAGYRLVRGPDGNLYGVRDSEADQ